MDSTADDDSRSSKRARLAAPAPAPPPAAAVDRISDLDDDVLLHILALLPDARDAARTGALSRRWHGLWTRVPALRLRFATRSVSTADLYRFVSQVNGVLAQRNSQQSDHDCAAIESLAISYAADCYDHTSKRIPGPFSAPWQKVMPLPCPIYPDSVRDELVPASVDAVQGWIRCAVQHRVRSLDVELSLPRVRRKLWRPYRERHGEGEKKPSVFLGGDDLPTSRLETLRLALSGAGLRLPSSTATSSTVKFASLTALSLENMEMPAGGARRLSRLVSSSSGSCPRLQKLTMRKICLDVLDDEMWIEAQVLSELVIEYVRPLASLKLRTPSLRILHLDTCSYEELSISAPRLEKVALFFQLPQWHRPRWLHIHGGLPCVRRVKLCLWSHRGRASLLGEAENQCGIQLLKHCTSLTCLDVTLEGQKESELDVNMIKRRIPHLPQVTSLTINVSVPLVRRHDFGARVANLLTPFNNLRHLRLRLPFFIDLQGYSFLCEHPNYWINDFSMGHLQEVEFTGFTGIDCELWFIEAMLASAKRLHKAAISFNPYYSRLPQGKMDAVERLLLGGGMWTFHRDTYEITCIRCSL